jgi:hypothetical protein
LSIARPACSSSPASSASVAAEELETSVEVGARERHADVRLGVHEGLDVTEPARQRDRSPAPAQRIVVALRQHGEL